MLKAYCPPSAGQRVEDAAGAARAKAEGLGEAAKEKATELKDAAARKADDVTASLHKEQESGMTATERASGRQGWPAISRWSQPAVGGPVVLRLYHRGCVALGWLPATACPVGSLHLFEAYF